MPRCLQVKITTRRAFDQGQLSGAELVQLLHGLARMPRYAPNHGWLAAAAEASLPHLPSMTPGEQTKQRGCAWQTAGWADDSYRGLLTCWWHSETTLGSNCHGRCNVRAESQPVPHTAHTSSCLYCAASFPHPVGQHYKTRHKAVLCRLLQVLLSTCCCPSWPLSSAPMNRGWQQPSPTCKRPCQHTWPSSSSSTSAHEPAAAPVAVVAAPRSSSTSSSKSRSGCCFCHPWTCSSWPKSSC